MRKLVDLLIYAGLLIFKKGVQNKPYFFYFIYQRTLCNGLNCLGLEPNLVISYMIYNIFWPVMPDIEKKLTNFIFSYQKLNSQTPFYGSNTRFLSLKEGYHHQVMKTNGKLIVSIANPIGKALTFTKLTFKMYYSKID
jgi:hypothetical protein